MGASEASPVTVGAGTSLGNALCEKACIGVLPIKGVARSPRNRGDHVHWAPLVALDLEESLVQVSSFIPSPKLS